MNRPAILRPRDGEDHAKVGFVELFFDLVFVFAVTRLSHSLLAHFSLQGALETGFLILAVWVVWMWTTWAANWLDARAAPVRILMLVLMGAGLIMSVSLPEAFGERGLIFAIAYAFIHNVRNAFTVWALRDGEENERRNFQRIQVWLVISGSLWIAGGFAEGDARWAFWIAALIAEMGAPWWGFYVPFMDASKTSDWAVDPGHMAERCGLFVILSLGESIIILGATFADLSWSFAQCAAFIIGFLLSVIVWWIYFATAAERAEQAFERHPDAGRIARAAYTYAHIPIVAGIILLAVADEFLLAHPTGHADQKMLAAFTGGPLLFLLGNAIFSRMALGRWPASHVAATMALVALYVVGPYLAPLAAGFAAVFLLAGVALWETLNPLQPAEPDPPEEALE